MNVTYDVPPHIIYKALTDQMAMCQFSQSQAISQLQVGGKYQLFGDTIQGEYEELAENEKIVMKWKFKEWENFGQCTVTFKPAEGGAVCEICVKVTGIPDYDRTGTNVHVDTLKTGWRQNIFKRIH